MRAIFPLLARSAIPHVVGCTSPTTDLDLTMTVQESGAGDTFVRTTDGGATWTTGAVPGADSLQFRDVHAVSSDTACLLSVGRGEQSRICKTTDGGNRRTRPFTSPEPEAFFDCLDSWDAEHGIAFSDALDGTFHFGSPLATGAGPGVAFRWRSCRRLPRERPALRPAARV